MNRRTLDARTSAVEAEPAPQVLEVAPGERESALRTGKLGRRAWIVRIISFVVVVGAWEILGRQVNPLFMSYPSEIVQAAVTLAQSGELPQALLESLRTLVLGFLAGSVAGVVIGLVVGRYRAAEWATDWLINALYATPLVAVVPLVILWFGLGFEAKLFIVFILTIFPVIINVAAGVRNIDRRYLDVGAAFAANERQVFQKIVLPSALPYIMVGLRLGIGRAIIGMVVAEFFTGITGLGAIITKYGNQFDTAAMLVPVLVLMALGVILTAGVRALERWIAPWKRDEEE